MAVEETTAFHENPETEPLNPKKQVDDNRSSSPRGVLEVSLSSLSSSSTVSGTSSCTSPTPTEKSSSSPRSSTQKDIFKDINIPWKNFVGGIKKTSVKKFSTSTIAMLTTYDLSKKTLKKKLARIRSAEDAIDCGLLPITKPTWRSFPYAELAHATDGFSPERMLGKGGHAEVYKGTLSDGTVVAVKRLIKENKDEEERTADFLSELGIIAHIDHQNTAKLVGFGVEKGLFLVLQFSPHGSLASHIHGSASECKLSWSIRFKVAVGVAEGLSYMHHECQRRIIHRDIKASNILLAEDFKPLISDFGLAKWLPDKWLHHVVHPIEGTFGYLAPEYFMHGIVDEKIDVFAFGVLLLELITGRHAVDSNRQSLAMWAKPYLDTNNAKELADPKLEGDYDPSEIKRAMITASMCIRHQPTRRPDMNMVVELLRGERNGVLAEVKQKTIAPRSLLLDACDLEDYTCSNYLNDLSRHRELLMDE